MFAQLTSALDFHGKALVVRAERQRVGHPDQGPRSHGGGVIPYLADRLSQWAKARPDLAALLPEGPMAELRRLNFDTASVTNQYALQPLLAFAGPERILFGTDFPFVSATPQLAELAGNRLDPATLSAIRHGNAERLLPALRT